MLEHITLSYREPPREKDRRQLRALSGLISKRIPTLLLAPYTEIQDGFFTTLNYAEVKVEPRVSGLRLRGLERIRNEVGLTQAELAEKIDDVKTYFGREGDIETVDAQFIREIESGRGIEDPSLLFFLGWVLFVPFYEFFTRSDLNAYLSDENLVYPPSSV